MKIPKFKPLKKKKKKKKRGGGSEKSKNVFKYIFKWWVNCSFNSTGVGVSNNDYDLENS